ncbi:hypothetical protein NDU88_002654 [Pleurodeles waltl]|uniref:Nuclease HARBI1 n=1 Tax=Pleurodeles waltl TaxID=8319 RepID=A0AAV7T2M0_PLEWA|nr:hypothetical protein NDU88_002654 [Pleurodeles waltl]
MMRWRHPLVYRPLVDLSTMEDRHITITYRLDRATIQELCAQLEPDLMSTTRHPTGIPPLVQVLSVLHFLASGCSQKTVAMASEMSQPMFSNVLTGVLSALLKHLRSYIVFPQEDGPDVGLVAAVEPVGSEEEEAEEEDVDNRNKIIMQYFQ